MRILIEAIGSLVSGATIKRIHEAGHTCVGIDANKDCYARFLVDEFYQAPLATDPCSKDFLFNLAVEKKIDLVMASLDDGLLIWSSMRKSLLEHGVHITLPDEELLKIFLDKWKTYLFFKEVGTPTPETSLKQDFPLVKPRLGRGGDGIIITDQKVDMEDMVSQEVLTGTEYTTDVLCDIHSNPVYIVPRVRLGVKEGKSTGGIVVNNEKIKSLIVSLCNRMHYVGAFNIQCFEDENGNVKFTELNPRLGGGTALGMAATENWIPLLIDTFINNKSIKASGVVDYGLKMGRYYSEIYYK